jgi:predicted dehydrogenase/threonine dehydrogenase-like Zn-dependent dehydrogenase
MRQLLQYFKSGDLEIIDSPIPQCGPRTIVSESTCSLISIGTEKMLLDFGKASLLKKAKQQPEKVKQVLDKIKTDGLITTFEAVKSKLDEPTPIGYSNVGKVIEVGEDVTEFKLGDRVISNGPHAEIVRVPWTLAAKIPANVKDEEAVFTILGSIAIEGIRLIQPTLGETIVVIGLGLLGNLTTQILKAHGCRVIGIDIDRDKVQLSNTFGNKSIISGTSEENINSILGFTNGIGADGIIITASTSSDEMLSQAALMCRKRGRIVLVGVIPISVPRNLFYEKELSFQVSSAYGPGRYDPQYEEKGIDYPLPYVRWTAKRNMEAFLFLLEERRINIQKLITHRFNFEDVYEAYQTIDNEKPLGIILNYSKKSQSRVETVILKNNISVEAKEMSNTIIGFIGAGNFAKMMLLPALKKTGVLIKKIASINGYDGVIAGKQFDILESTSDNEQIFQDKNIDTVFIATPHNSHASLVIKCLESNKNVFVEKPLAIDLQELRQIYDIMKSKSTKRLMVGFNRRFSPYTLKVINKLKQRSDPISIIITVNAGWIPQNHWVHDPEIGGGRIIGEVCHFIDLARHLCSSPIQVISAISTRKHSQTDEDKVIITLGFEDGSHAAIHYLANGNKKYPKERVEIFSSGRVYEIHNFKKLSSFGDSLKLRTLKQDKGHFKEVSQFVKSVKEKRESPIPLDQIFEIHLATFAVKKAVNQKRFVEMSEMWEELKL